MPSSTPGAIAACRARRNHHSNHSIREENIIMNKRTFLSCLAILVMAIIGSMAASSAASAQCNAPGCNFITVDTYITGCCARITSFECSDGTRTPPTTPSYCGESSTPEPCPCPDGTTLAAIWVGPTRIPVGTAATATAGGCTYFYDVQFFTSGCIRIKIT